MMGVFIKPNRNYIISYYFPDSLLTRDAIFFKVGIPPFTADEDDVLAILNASSGFELP